MPPIWISVIGRCEVHLGRSRIKPESAVFFGLLLYLGLRPGVRVTREELLELLWPGSPEQARRHSLRQLLYRIRRAEVPLELDGPEVVLDAAHVHSDIGALFAGGWADGVSVADIPHPREMFAGYRHSLGAPFSAWMDGVRDDACVEIRRACTRHIAEGRREGRWADVETAARICIVCDPLNEGAHMALAEALAMTGARAEALRELDAFFWEVRDSGGQPGREAQSLRDRISAQPEFHSRRLGDLPLVGRADEIRWLNHHSDAADAGTPVAVQLVGVPGIGKTAIVRAFLASTEMRGWSSVVARMQPHDVDRPLSLFIELVPHLLAARGSIGAAPESVAQLRRLVEQRDEDDKLLAGLSREAEAVQARIRTSLTDVIGAIAHESALVVALEDLHWIDWSSLGLLAWLVSHVVGVRLLWLLTTRPESGFERLRQIFPSDRVPSLEIAPLAERDSRTLLAAFAPQLTGHPSAANIAFAATGGNPLFIREVAAHMSASRDTTHLPGTLRALMAERVSRLKPTSRRVLSACAVLGRFASVQRVAAVLDMPTAHLALAAEDLGGLGLVGLAGDSGTLGLHDLWQEHLMGSMPASVRSFLHLRAGQVLETEATHVQASALAIAAAMHLELGGSKEAALRLLEGVIVRCLRVGLYEDAVECSDSAIAIAPDDRRRLAVAELRLEALEFLGRWQAILDSIAYVRGLAHASGQSRGHHSRLELLAIKSDMLNERRFDGALAALTECVASPSADAHHRADAARLGARAASNCFMADELKALLQVVTRLDRSDPHVRAQTLAVETIYHADLGDIETARQSAAALVAVERSRRSLTGLCHALRNQTVPFRITGEFAAASAVALEAYNLSISHHLPTEIALCADIVGSIMFEHGRLSEASKWLASAEPHLARIGGDDSRESIVHVQAMIAVEEGDLDGAAALISGLDWKRHQTFNRMALVELALATRLAALRGDRPVASVLCEALKNRLASIASFRRLGYAAASLGICVAFLEGDAAAKEAVATYRRPDDTKTLVWRELSRWH